VNGAPAAIRRMALVSAMAAPAVRGTAQEFPHEMRIITVSIGGTGKRAASCRRRVCRSNESQNFPTESTDGLQAAA
jgi:hypothetical protein